VCAPRTLPPDFDCNSYILIRLYNLCYKDNKIIGHVVDLEAGHDEILCTLELEDGFFELGVLETYILELKELLNRELIQYSVDWKYQPFNPSFEAVQSFLARQRMIYLFLRRAKGMIKQGFPMKRYWYSHLVKLIPWKLRVLYGSLLAFSRASDNDKQINHHHHYQK